MSAPVSSPARQARIAEVIADWRAAWEAANRSIAHDVEYEGGWYLIWTPRGDRPLRQRELAMVADIVKLRDRAAIFERVA